jgi:hypothetical protein
VQTRAEVVEAEVVVRLQQDGEGRERAARDEDVDPEDHACASDAPKEAC